MNKPAKQEQAITRQVDNITAGRDNQDGIKGQEYNVNSVKS